MTCASWPGGASPWWASISRRPPSPKRARARTDNVSAEFIERDLFTLGGDYAYAFDGVWEYTCFCAIDPRRRSEYVRTMREIVKPGGWLLACFFPMRRRGAGPPFPVSEREVRRLFAP